MKLKSKPHLLMLFTDTSNIVEEGDPQIIKTLEMEETNLLIMSPMKQHSRTTSPSPLPIMLSLWDPSHTSLTEIEPEQKHSLLSILDTSC